MKERCEHTHYPVPSNVKVSEGLEQIIGNSENDYIWTYGGCGPKSSLRDTQVGTPLVNQCSMTEPMQYDRMRCHLSASSVASIFTKIIKMVGD